MHICALRPARAFAAGIIMQSKEVDEFPDQKLDLAPQDSCAYMLYKWLRICNKEQNFVCWPYTFWNEFF